jgi:hypothetical protein
VEKAPRENICAESKVKVKDSDGVEWIQQVLGFINTLSGSIKGRIYLDHLLLNYDFKWNRFVSYTTESFFRHELNTAERGSSSIAL